MTSSFGMSVQSHSRPAAQRLFSFGVILAVPILTVTTALRSQETYENFVKRQKEGEAKEGAAFAQYKDSVTAEYQRFLERDRRAFKQYVDDIRKRWGKEKAKTSSRKEWVSYDGDFGARRSVDFEKGQASVEVQVEKDLSASEVRKRVEKQIVKMITDRGEADPLEAKQKAPSTTQVLEGQLKTTNDAPVSVSNAEAYAGEILSKVSVQREPVVGGDGTSRIVARVSFPLVPDHIRVRAETYRKTVAKNALKFGVEAPLVFAVIHTESCFNPRARSSAPAYGLMQLVPQSGARAAYLYVYGEDKLVAPEQLYNPSNNIELGSGYLSLLMTKNFKDVSDPLSRSYCAIAAYNTGPANVATAFTGKKDVPEAVRRINGMTADQVFARLRSNLPYPETRDYIANVSGRIKLYTEWK